MIDIRAPLSPEEVRALNRLAEVERRDVRGQAAILIRDALVDRGFLSTTPEQQVTKETEDRHAPS